MCYRAIFCFLPFFSALGQALSGTALAADMLGYHGGDTTSIGVNSGEQAFTPGSVASTTTFGKLFTTPITDTPNLTGLPSSAIPAGNGYNWSTPAGAVYAEPLVKTGVNITTGNFQGTHDVVFVATSMDSLYAIDANNGTVLWKDSFIYNASGNPNPVNAGISIPIGVTAVPGGAGSEINSSDINPWVGIVDTPVIDGVNGFIYFVAKTREAHGTDSTDEASPHYVLTLHKVSLSNGADTNTVIADTTYLNNSGTISYAYNSGPYVVAGQSNPAGSTTVSGQRRIYVNAVRQMVRPALQLYGGRIYIASASHGDNGPYHGWILTYDAGTLALNGVWCATPYGSGGEGGIWQGGGGVVIDPANGNIFFITGNGDFDGNISNGVVSGLSANGGTTGFPVHNDYGDCFVKLQLDSTTTPTNQGTNGWGLKLVDYFAPYNNQTLSGGDQDLGSGGPCLLPDSVGSAAHPHLLVGGGKEGKLYLVDRDNMGQFAATDHVVQTVANVLVGSLSVPAYFNGVLYATPGYGGNMRSWSLSNATIGPSVLNTGPDNFGFPGCSPFITANGTIDGVVWSIDNGTQQLRAYDASQINSELYTSAQNSSRDALGATVKFSCPTPINSHVYVGTTTQLVTYGLINAPTSAPAAPSGLTAVPTTASTVLLTWTDNSNNEDDFRIERSSDGINFAEIGSVGVNVTEFGDSGLSSQATYYYRVRAANSFDGVSFSGYSNMVMATTPAVGTIAAADLYHFDEGSGTTTVDSAGSNPGTLIGNPLPGWMTPGRIGSADLSFSGDGQTLANQNGEGVVQLQNDLSPILGQTSSLIFWIKTTQKGSVADIQHYSNPAVTGVEDNGATNDINWGTIDNNGDIGIAVGDSGSVMSANPINDNNWHHVAITRNAGTGACNVYIDGVLSSSAQLETGGKTMPFSLIGALSVVSTNGTFTGANFFNGQLDDVQVFNQIVTASFVAAEATAPTAPAGLTVNPASGTELDLSWNDTATNATGYEVWSSVNGAAYTKIATLASSATSYMDVGLTQGIPYSFYVVAVGYAGSNSTGMVNSATPNPPTTPSGASVTLLAATEIDMQWTDNATNETGYTVLRRTGTGDYAPVASLPANSTTYHDTTVQPGTTYDYHIEAYNIAGYSDFSGFSVTTPAAPTFSSYMSAFGITDPILAAPTADPYHIGIANLVAYAFNLNPTVAITSGLPTVAQASGHLAISFVERIGATDVNYVVEVSSDMVNWNSGPNYTTQGNPTPIDSATQLMTVTDTTPLSATPERFIRVVVTH